MKRNIGEKDSLTRLFTGLGLVVLAVVFIKALPVAVILIAYAVAIVLAGTAMVGNCPLYTLLGIDTKHGKAA